MSAAKNSPKRKARSPRARRSKVSPVFNPKNSAHPVEMKINAGSGSPADPKNSSSQAIGNPYQNFNFFALSAIYGLTAVRILYFLSGPPEPHNYQIVYLMAWLVALVFGFSMGKISALEAHHESSRLGLSLHVLVHFIFLLVILRPFTWGSSLGWKLIIVFCFLQLLVSTVSAFVWRNEKGRVNHAIE